jgi:hypothetical protein
MTSRLLIPSFGLLAKYGIGICLLWGLAGAALAQKPLPTKTIKEKSLVTGQEVEWKITGDDRVVARDSSLNYLQIYVRSSEQVLYGNKCAEDEAKRMGIEFVLLSKDIGYGMSESNRRWSNFKTGCRVFFKNGFFWKKRLKKRIRLCREATGDHSR